MRNVFFKSRTAEVIIIEVTGLLIWSGHGWLTNKKLNIHADINSKLIIQVKHSYGWTSEIVINYKVNNDKLWVYYPSTNETEVITLPVL